MSRRVFPMPAVLAAVLASACSDRSPLESDPAPPGSPEPAAPSPLAGAAFRLTIDVRSGRVEVAPPATPSVPASPASFSLLGADAVAVTASPCTWSAVPNNAKLRRCTLALTVGSRLPTTDLVTPTVFPRAPQGTTGILVFPFSAAGLGTPGGGAAPNADWDNAPANLFNDFSGCSTSKTTDCYRSETFLAPLYGGETSEPRAVGFDVDKDAHTVSAYVVVAADLRDNPLRTLVVPPEAQDCGIVQDFGTTAERIERNSFQLQAANFPGIGERRSLCSFNLAALPLDADVRSATLGLYQFATSDEIINGPVAVEHLVFGSLDASDFALPALNIGIATLPTTDEDVLRVADVRGAVRDDLAAGRFRFQMRLRFALPPGGGEITESVLYYGPRGDVPPSLTLTYRRR